MIPLILRRPESIFLTTSRPVESVSEGSPPSSLAFGRSRSVSESVLIQTWGFCVLPSAISTLSEPRTIETSESRSSAVICTRRLGPLKNRALSGSDCRLPSIRSAMIAANPNSSPRLMTRVNYCSSTNSVGTCPAMFTSSLEAFTYRTMVGRSPLSLSFPCIIPLIGSSSFLMTSFHRE